MKADYLSYQRATSRSLMGLGIQFALALVFLLYGIFGHDEAARNVAIFMVITLPVWLVLAVLFDQHRRERIEAIEAEAFAASDAATSTVFENQADDLRVAARRLKWMYRFLVPIASLGTAGLLIGIGIWRFTLAKALLGAHLPDINKQGWGMALGLTAAVIGIAFARYLSAMSRQRAWANLRAGAALAAGSALLGLALALGHFIRLAGQDGFLKYLPLAVPLFMVALGCEVVLNFVLDIYRPRKAGEHPRPAFESRVLGLAAAPDRIAESIGEAINYQFGYDVSSSWFYLLLSRSVFRVLIPVGLIVAWAMTAMAVIQPHERGMVLRFGEFSRVIDPGLNFKWPWPVETVEVPVYKKVSADGRVQFASHTVTGVRTLNIGSLPAPLDKAVLWTNEHAAKEGVFLVQPGSSAGGEGGRTLAVLAIEVPLNYEVGDLYAYDELAPEEMRDDLLKAVAQRELMQYVSSLTVNELLSGKRNELQGELRRRIENAFAQFRGPGDAPAVKVLFVGADGLHPPQEAAISFEQVVGAEQMYHAAIKSAEGDAIQTLTKAAGSVELANQIVKELDVLAAIPTMIDSKPNPAAVEQRLKVRGLIQTAGGDAAETIQKASADRWDMHMGARAALSEYRGQLGSYRAAPEIYRAGLYLDALRSAMAESRVFITDAPKYRPRFNFEDREDVSSIFQSQQPKDQ